MEKHKGIRRLLVPIMALMLACAFAPAAFADEVTAGTVDPAQPQDISGAVVTMDVYKFTYTGYDIVPNVTVTFNGATLVKDVDYVVACDNNKNIGTATLIVQGKGNYTGNTPAKKFYILRKSLKASDVTVKNVKKSYTYTGKKIKPVPAVYYNGKKLKKGTDYYLKYKNNKAVGTAKLYIMAKGNFKSKKIVKFKIKRESLEDADVETIDDRTYTGDWIHPTPTVTLNGKRLVRGRD